MAEFLLMKNRTSGYAMLVACLAALAVLFLLALSPQKVEEAVESHMESLDHPFIKISHLEMLSDHEAVVFYQYGLERERYFGEKRFERGLFGWEHKGGSVQPLVGESHMKQMDVQYVGLHRSFEEGFTDLIYGYVYDPDIVRIDVTSNLGRTYRAMIPGHGNDRMWLIYTGDGEHLYNSIITAYDRNGEVVKRHGIGGEN
ncbi:hypothetical protein [Alteribacter natronophilus]|uniref:hypothetical protein n=1 Tax=Alteribacter natronophilus TaxID=2583810 RepID=UPI00110EBACC|nr:hypothetical protein [Alteribacter natronophilus]TMW71440.1 hypothetical protein FGB90_10350 [Alteribacter natronophilus]